MKISHFIGYITLLWAVGYILASAEAQVDDPSNGVLMAPFDVAKWFVPSGFMGDGERGNSYVRVATVAAERPRPGSTVTRCIKVSYKPGAVGWAGVYWQRPENNWGEKPGATIRDATKLIFWAAGQKGGEIVEFKSGGISGNKYRDSFEASIGSVTLTKDWKSYEIRLKGHDLTSVVGAFAWVATATDNPGGLTFYLDGLRFE